MKRRLTVVIDIDETLGRDQMPYPDHVLQEWLAWELQPDLDLSASEIEADPSAFDVTHVRVIRTEKPVSDYEHRRVEAGAKALYASALDRRAWDDATEATRWAWRRDARVVLTAADQVTPEDRNEPVED